MMRKSGILMHISSLPSDYGIGAMGEEAYRFVDFLKATCQGYWQVLPLNPTDYVNSPYQSPGVFAGNSLLIDLGELKKEGLLSDSDFDGCEFGREFEKVDFEAVRESKTKLLKIAFSRFRITGEYSSFESENAFWLDDYSLFMALGEHFEGKCWYSWDEGIKNRKPEAMNYYANLLWQNIAYYKFEQYIFQKQWLGVKKYANENGVEIIGDIPIYVAHNSVDVWANPKLFLLDKEGMPSYIAGCPPDAFSADGQIWGNPLYDWKRMKQDGYMWWLNRLRASMKFYDIVRLDHFRGFESYFAIPEGDQTAKNGHWEKGPGLPLFKSVKKNIPECRIIAEDLGYLTEDVYKLLDSCGFAGMKVLQFAFDPNNDNPYLPYNHVKNCVVYTGTHDNDTLVGWYQNEPNKEFIRDYLNVSQDEWVPAAMIRMVLASSADTAIIPIQDYLGYGRRMNTPSTVGEDNWSFRIRKDSLNDEVKYHIGHLTNLYKRNIKI